VGTVDRCVVWQLREAQQGAIELLGCATEQAAAAPRKEGIPTEEVCRPWCVGWRRDQVGEVILGVSRDGQDFNQGPAGGLTVEGDLLAISNGRVDPKGEAVRWPNHSG
jgi:hypothetical protein